MDNRLAVNPDQITATSGEFTDLADAAHRIPADVAGKLPPVLDIFGRDKYGEAVANNVGPALDGARQLLTGVGDFWSKTDGDLKVAADLYRKADGINTQLGLGLNRPRRG
jgi:hypothetical protein